MFNFRWLTENILMICVNFPCIQKRQTKHIYKYIYIYIFILRADLLRKKQQSHAATKSNVWFREVKIHLRTHTWGSSHRAGLHTHTHIYLYMWISYIRNIYIHFYNSFSLPSLYLSVISPTHAHTLFSIDKCSIYLIISVRFFWKRINNSLMKSSYLN